MKRVYRLVTLTAHRRFHLDLDQDAAGEPLVGNATARLHRRLIHIKAGWAIPRLSVKQPRKVRRQPFADGEAPMTKRALKPDGTNFSPFPLMPAFNSTLVDTLTRTGETCAKACLAWQNELFRFMTSRILWDGKVGQALVSSKTLGEALELERNWLQSTVQDYVDEANRLNRLAARLAPALDHSGRRRSKTAAKESEPRRTAE